MATVTLASFANETVRFEIDYDDASLRITTFRGINGGDQNARGTLYAPGGQIISQQVFVAGETLYVPIGGNRKVVIKDGEPWSPFSTRFEYPIT